MFERLIGGSRNVLRFKISDRITAEDVRDMSRIMADAIAASGKIRLLIEIEGFRYMEPEALREKLEFVRDHAKNIEKMAVVSDRTWIKAWLKVGTFFTHKEGEHFNRAEIQAAWEWVRQ